MLPDLRLDIPTLEPDPVLLEQLSQLSRASVPARRNSAARSVAAAVTALLVGCLSWLTGTLPGVASPLQREPSHHGPSRGAPATTPDDKPRPAADPAPAGSGDALPGVPPAVASGHTKPHHDNGLHLGQTKPHQDNGHHGSQSKPHKPPKHPRDPKPPHHGSQGGHGNGHRA